MESGFLLVDKPLGWTSHDVVAKLRGITKIKKIGHGGTLDPLATGLLVVGIGTATKQLDKFAQGDKTYVATVRLGATSTTDDAEGEIIPVEDHPKPVADDVADALQSFEGRQKQIPPSYSAIKKAGRKMYELARAGETVTVEPRQITVYDIDLLNYKWPDVTFRVSVSKGTYIRSLARDLGSRLKAGGYLASLRREQVGDLSVDDAASMETLEADWKQHLLPSS